MAQVGMTVVGRYPFQALAAGASLRADQLSESVVAEQEMEDRELLSVPVKVGAIDRAIKPGAHVSLVLSPQGGCCPALPPPLALDDVIVWGVDRRSDRDDRSDVTSIVVAIKGIDCADAVEPYLGISDVFMWQPAGRMVPSCQPGQPTTPTSTPTTTPTNTPTSTPTTTPTNTPTSTPTTTPTSTLPDPAITPTCTPMPDPP